jgi:hypothetical protein
MAEPSILELSDAERSWVAQQIAAAAALARVHVGRDEPLPSLETLGATFSAWSNSPGDQRHDANSVVLALGAAFGQHLVDGLGLRWVIVSDEHGTDLAVHGQPGDMLMFPISSTAKRCETGDFGFFPVLYAMMRDDVSKRRREA